MLRTTPELEKAKIKIAELSCEKSKLVKAKDSTEKKLGEKQTELDILKTNLKNVKCENEKISSQLKSSTKAIKSKNNEINILETKNENLLEIFFVSTLTKEKNRIL